MYSTKRITKKQSNKKPIFRSDGKVIGGIVGDTLVKRVFASKHMLRTPLGWAVNEDVIQQVKAACVHFIEIRDLESGRIYRSTLENFVRYGIKFDRGFGAQIVLPLDRWTVISDPNTLQMAFLQG